MSAHSVQEAIRQLRQTAGLPESLETSEFNSIHDAFVAAALRYTDKIAVSTLDQTLTYQELEKLSAAFAAYLQTELKLAQGTRVAIQMPNLVHYPVVLFGVLRAGMIVVNTNPQYIAREMLHQFNDSGAEVLVVVKPLQQLAMSLVGDTKIRQLIVVDAAEQLAAIFKSTNPTDDTGNSVVAQEHQPCPVTSLKEALYRGIDCGLNEISVQVNDIALLQYTGGTTGVSKGAMITHRNLLANIAQVRLSFGCDAQYHAGTEVMVQPLPLYHIYAFTLSVVMWEDGNEVALATDPRNLPALTTLMKQRRMSYFTGINTLFVLLCNDADFLAMDFRDFKSAISGGMALTDSAAQRWQEVTSVSIAEGYGMTEASPTITSNPRNILCPGTVGVPVPGTEIKVVGDSGEELGFEQPGELLVRGPQVMLGYWQRAEETKEMLSVDGWLKTGDIAQVTNDGYIQIVDRKKDMIVVSGFNVYPNEVEGVAVMHPAIKECAVIGIKDEKSGEVPKLFVVLNDDEQSQAMSEKELIDFCRQNLAAYKVPRSVEFRNELPKSNVGKILRRGLR